MFFAYVLVRHLLDPAYSSILGALNLGIHELGHFVFGFFGEFMGVAGGTLLQLLIPVFGMFNFWKQEDYFSIALCFGWLSTNFFAVALYAADAQAMELPLVTPFGGESVIHDWNFMLGRLGILEYDAQAGMVFKVLAVIAMLVCFAAGGWMIFLMITQKSNTGEHTV